MKQLKLFTIAICIVLFTGICYGQGVEERNKVKMRRVYFGLKLGFGYSNPSDVNRYINEYYQAQGFNIKEGSADIDLYLNMDLHLSIFATRNIELKLAYEAAIAYSTVQDVDMIGMDNDRINMLIRLSPSLVCNYHFYVKNENSLYLGGGVAFDRNFLYVDKDGNTLNGKAVGLKLNCGFMMKSSWHPLYFEFEYNMASTDSNRSNSSDNGYYDAAKPQELNFSGLNINIGINF